MNEDLISRSALSEKLQAHHDFFVNGWGGFSNLPIKDKIRVDEITNCIAEVMNAPAVDAVKVVRCKDCKHGDIDDPVFPCQYYCHMGHMWNDAYHFCADGERRAEDAG